MGKNFPRYMAVASMAIPIMVASLKSSFTLYIKTPKISAAMIFKKYAVGTAGWATKIFPSIAAEGGDYKYKSKKHKPGKGISCPFFDDFSRDPLN